MITLTKVTMTKEESMSLDYASMSMEAGSMYSSMVYNDNDVAMDDDNGASARVRRRLIVANRN